MSILAQGGLQVGARVSRCLKSPGVGQGSQIYEGVTMIIILPPI